MTYPPPQLKGVGLSLHILPVSTKGRLRQSLQVQTGIVQTPVGVT